MQILFVHQNIPGQFRHLLFDLLRRPGYDVWALGEASRVKANWSTPLPGLHLYGYAFNEKAVTIPNGPLKTTDVNIRRGLAVAKSLHTLKEKGLQPDVILGHPGWGEMLFVRDVFPNARIVNYCEFYFNFDGQDLGFDPEFHDAAITRYDVRAQNMTQSQSLLAADLGLSPTRWQKSRYPAPLQSQIEVVFDGIDCDVVRPDAEAWFALPSGEQLSSRDEVVTFVNRNLEPHRGFHVFMRALPELQRRRPRAHVVIVGAEGVSYSRPLRDRTYRQHYQAELGDRVDWSRVHFVGRVSYRHYLGLLQISAAHVYLTYPFVLSWSLMEAMAASCCVIASRTAPVEEVIVDGETGMLVDFFDASALAQAIEQACGRRAEMEAMRRRARELIVDRYDLHRICLPEQKRLLALH